MIEIISSGYFIRRGKKYYEISKEEYKKLEVEADEKKRFN